MGLFDKLKKKTVDDYAKEGDALCDQGKLSEAIEIWKQGLASLPEPINAQSEAVWFQVSIGDTYFMQGQYERAYGYLLEAKSNLSGEGATNPFVMMRLGQSAYELGKDDSREYLLRAYMLEGEGIFEEENEKYLESIKDLIG